METLAKTSDYETERQKPIPSKNHSILQKRTLVTLSVKYDKNYEIMSEISLDLADWESTPDIAICPKMPIDFSVDEVRLTTPPLGVIEILSPTQSLQELTTKIGQYFAKGVQSCWLVLPTLKSIYVYQDSQTFQPYTAQDILIDKQLNIELTLAAIFQG